ncbi:MAG: hypothetical protein IJN77_03105 [Oscillospiraceae bacterium]|nr:hypothetical protein [Oscillospiraceae bacterium]
MKNRKILYLTVFSVVVVIIGIICFSRLAENIWQATGEIDNNLNVDESALYQENIVIDYPYYMLNDHKVYIDKEFQKNYSSIVDMYNRTKVKPDYMFNNFSAPELNYSHQDIANICGEAIKYLYGRADLQNNKSAVIFNYITEDNLNEWLANYWYNDEFQVAYNLETGEFEYIECWEQGASIKEDTTDTSTGSQDYYYTDDVKLDIEQMIYESLSIIKPEAEIVNIKYSTDTNYVFKGVYHLRARIDYKDGKEAELCFRTKDFDVYELDYYVQRGIAW